MRRTMDELSKCKFMTYEEGGMYYGIGWVRFRKIARKANAIFRMGKRYLVVKEIIDKKYVRYKEGAERYSMGLHTFQELAKEANAIYRV